jgi:hypothetical protein
MSASAPTPQTRSARAAALAVLALALVTALAAFLGSVGRPASAITGTVSGDRAPDPAAVIAAQAQAAAGHEAADAAARAARPRVVEVDVAEDHTRFFFDEAPVFDDGFPAAGNSFSTAGYLYPVGTLGPGEEGVAEDGSPTRPDEVIGEWLCRGSFIGEGAHATEGSWVFSTQLFSFGDDPTAGRTTVVVTGYEGAGVGERVTGAITGGTGHFRTASGQAVQELLGFTLFEGNDDDMPIKKRVRLELTRPAPPR